MGATALRRAHELEPMWGARPQRLFTAEEPLDRAHQTLQRLTVEHVLTTEVVDHLRDRHTTLVALVALQRQIAHHLPALGPPRCRPQIHPAYTLTTRADEHKPTTTKRVPTRFQLPANKTPVFMRTSAHESPKSTYLVRKSGEIGAHDPKGDNETHPMRNTGCRGATRRSSCSSASGPTPSKKTPTSNLQRFR